MDQRATVTRARKTSDEMLSAAAIAVVSAVNPDKPGAFLFSSFTFVSLLLIFISNPCFAQSGYLTRTALNNAVYQNSLINVTPMLFHHLELGMTYDSLVAAVGKSAIYCDSGETHCTAENGSISRSCVSQDFIERHKKWRCHWDGNRSNQNIASKLEVWLVGDHVDYIRAAMPDGMIYTRDSSNTIRLEKTTALGF